jgi:glycosyltransferase involved in cell wall biosynthesis
MIWFVTPAFRRYELSAVCFDQRKQVIAQLVKQGIEAYCVVVADDENLELARERGFSTVEQNNDWLGRKFNDGMEYAGKHGAQWIVPIGSDSWIDPGYFLPLPKMTRTSGMYAVVTADRMAVLNVGKHGAGPYMFHRSSFRRGFRPAGETLSRFIDSSMIKGMGDLTWERKDVHPYQYIGFRGTPHLTPYDALWQAWGVREDNEPWARLAEHYDPALVEQARLAL